MELKSFQEVFSMLKKLFLFAGLVVSFILGLGHLYSSLNFFLQYNDTFPVIYVVDGIVSAVIFLVVLAIDIPAVVLTIKKIKEGKDLLVPTILLAVMAAILFVGGQAIYGIEVGTNIDHYTKAMNEAELSGAGEEVVKNYARNISIIVFNFIISFIEPTILAALAVLSFFNFGDKSNNQAVEA